MLTIFENANYYVEPPKVTFFDKIKTLQGLNDKIDITAVMEDMKNHGKTFRLSYNKNICKEIEDYFVMQVSNEFAIPVYDKIGIIARNLIPDIVRIRRKVGYFKLKLLAASISDENPNLIDFIFISVDENENENNKVSFERIGSGDVKIIIEQ